MKEGRLCKIEPPLVPFRSWYARGIIPRVIGCRPNYRGRSKTAPIRVLFQFNAEQADIPRHSDRQATALGKPLGEPDRILLEVVIAV